MFCVSSSVGEFSLAYNLRGDGYEAQGKSEVFSFFLNIPCQIIGASYMAVNTVQSAPKGAHS